VLCSTQVSGIQKPLQRKKKSLSYNCEITLIHLGQGTGKLCDISLLEHWECSETNANFKFATTTTKLKMRLNRRRISMIEDSEKMQGGF